MPNTKPHDEGMRTVIVALAANFLVAVVKAIAGILTASAGLLAEAAHSVGDCTTELFLVTALRRADRPADRRHPFGYGKERYFWSLLAAISIVLLGAGFSFYQGVSTINGGESGAGKPVVGYVVIAIAAIAEGSSLRQAFHRVRGESKRTNRTIPEYVKQPDDPTAKSVVLEDTAALIGLGFALAGLLLRQLTGDDVWDGIAALAIGALLVVVAYELARTNMDLLIGQQANPKLVADIAAFLRRQSEVLDVVDVRTMMIGTGRVLLCARVDYIEELSATDVERTGIRLHTMLGQQFADLEDVFIEPVPRYEASVRATPTRPA